jgi:hypothetical protein
VIAQAIIGSLIMAGLAAIAAANKLTGQAPSDEGERQAFNREGKQPFSVEIGGRWVPYNRYAGPISLLLAAVAAGHDAVANGQKAPSEQLSAIASTLGKAMVQQSFFEGLSNLMNAIQDPQRYGARFSSDVASGFIPFSGALRTAADALDPDVREPQGMYQRVIAGLPVLSKSLPPELDELGRPEERAGGTGADALLPGALPSSQPPAGIDAELARLNRAGLPAIGRAGSVVTVDGERMKLTTDERNEYQRLRGAFLRSYLDDLFQSKEYAAMGDDDKLQAAQERIHEAEADALDEMRNRQATRTARASGGVPRTPPVGVGANP